MAAAFVPHPDVDWVQYYRDVSDGRHHFSDGDDEPDAEPYVAPPAAGRTFTPDRLKGMIATLSRPTGLAVGVRVRNAMEEKDDGLALRILGVAVNEISTYMMEIGVAARNPETEAFARAAAALKLSGNRDEAVEQVLQLDRERMQEATRLYRWMYGADPPGGSGWDTYLTGHASDDDKEGGAVRPRRKRPAARKAKPMEPFRLSRARRMPADAAAAGMPLAASELAPPPALGGAVAPLPRLGRTRKPRAAAAMGAGLSYGGKELANPTADVGDWSTANLARMRREGEERLAEAKRKQARDPEAIAKSVLSGFKDGMASFGAPIAKGLSMIPGAGAAFKPLAEATAKWAQGGTDVKDALLGGGADEPVRRRKPRAKRAHAAAAAAASGEPSAEEMASAILGEAALGGSMSAARGGLMLAAGLEGPGGAVPRRKRAPLSESHPMRARNALVSKLMKEHGLSLAEASKAIAKHGLWSRGG